VELKRTRSVVIPVEISRPVLGHLIMTTPIKGSFQRNDRSRPPYGLLRYSGCVNPV
jgi:hypothetical protein